MQLVWSIRGPSRSHTRSLPIPPSGSVSGWPASRAVLPVISKLAAAHRACLIPRCFGAANAVIRESSLLLSYAHPSTVRKRRKRSSASKVPSLSQIARSPRLASSRQEGHQRHQQTRHVRASSDVTHSPLPSSSPSPLHLVVRLPADLRATSLVAFLTPRRLSLVTHAVSPFPPVHMVTRTAGAASGPCKSHAGPGRAHSLFLCRARLLLVQDI